MERGWLMSEIKLLRSYGELDPPGSPLRLTATDFYTGYRLADHTECEICGYIGKAAEIPLLGWVCYGCIVPAEAAVIAGTRRAHLERHR